MEKRSAEITALVERARKGDKTASAELYEKMYDKLYFFALKNVRSKEDAEDIVQEAFMKALESLDELNSSESFSGWIYSVTYNLCIDKMRGGKRVARFETEDDRDNAIENSALNEPVMVPEDYMQNEETKRQIKDVIDGLRPDMRSAVILYYYDQMSIAEIAETMNLSESGVKSKLYQARKKIKTKLEKLGVDRSVTVHMSLVPIPALIALVADELDTSAAVVASPFGKAAVTVTAGVTVLGAAAAMAFFANVHKGDMRIDSGIDSAESTVSIYTEEQSSVNSLSESVLTSSLSISSMAQNNILSDSQNGAVNTDTSTQSNYDSYVNTPNSSNYYDIPYTSSNDSNSSSRSSSNNSSRRGSQSSSAVSNSSSSESLESSSVADSSSNSEYLDADFFATFHYYIDDDGIVLTGYEGDDTVVKIPEEHNGKPIVKITDAFIGSNSDVEEVFLPDSLTTLERYALVGNNLKSIHIGKGLSSIGIDVISNSCNTLTTITVDPENPNFTAYDGGLYTKDLSEVVFYTKQVKEVNLPSSVKKIRGNAFGSCQSLTDIYVPDGVTELGEYAFYNCTNLKSIRLPDSMTIIEERAFCDCKSLENIAIPYNVKVLYRYVFQECVSLKNLLTREDLQKLPYGDLFFGDHYGIGAFYNSYSANSQEEWYALYEQHFK